MAICMQNEKSPHKSLCLATPAWLGILELALDYGWNPMGAGLQGAWHAEVSLDSYFPSGGNGRQGNGSAEQGQLVLLDDALNLADALDRAFKEYEPQRVKASYFLFEPDDPYLRRRPSIGALLAVIDLCYLGAFWIKPHTRQALLQLPTIQAAY